MRMRQAVKRDVWEQAQTGHLETWIGYARNREARCAERAPVWWAIPHLSKVLRGIISAP